MKRDYAELHPRNRRKVGTPSLKGPRHPWRQPPRAAQPGTKTQRRVVLAAIAGLVLLGAYQLFSDSGALRVKQIAVSGSNHYTHGEIVAALGMVNVHTLSESEVENRLKRRLSYVKQASVSKSVLQRSLSIEITEREPVALIEYTKNGRSRFVLVDFEGYVLEYKDIPRATNEIRIFGDGPLLEEPGDKIQSEKIQLALSVLRVALELAPEIVPMIGTINADQPNRITLQFKDSPVVAWLSSDLIETGLYQLAVFMRVAPWASEKEKRQLLSGYLDARFEDAIYWGGRK